MSISRKGHRATLAPSAAKTLFGNKNTGCAVSSFIVILLIVVLAYLIYRYWKTMKEQREQRK